MNGLVEDGFIVIGGPLGDGRDTLLIVRAEGEDEIRARLDDDPWVPMKLLRLMKVEPWQVLLGGPAA